MLRKIIDWKLQWVQSLLLFVPFFVSLFCGESITKLLTDFLEQTDYKILLIFTRKIWWLCTLTTIVIAQRIRSYNGDDKIMLNDNNDCYHDHCYYGYLFCAWVLGYKKCNMRLVPIPLQVKLILNGTFKEYVYTDGINKSHQNERAPKIRRENDSCFTRCVNLVLIDTYAIHKEQLPPEVHNLTTIYIERFRSENNNTRYSSGKFVEAVLNEVRHLPEVAAEINVFATLNTENCYNIVKQVFSTGRRDHIKHLYVYNQEQESPRHFSGRVKIY